MSWECPVCRQAIESKVQRVVIAIAESPTDINLPCQPHSSAYLRVRSWARTHTFTPIVPFLIVRDDLVDLEDNRSTTVTPTTCHRLQVHQSVRGDRPSAASIPRVSYSSASLLGG